MRLFKEAALPVPTRKLKAGPQEIRVGCHRTKKEIPSRALIGGHHPLEQTSLARRISPRHSAGRAHSTATFRLRAMGRQVRRKRHRSARSPRLHGFADFPAQLAHHRWSTLHLRLVGRRLPNLAHPVKR